MTEKQSDQSDSKPKKVYTKKASSRGGARAGSGRPKGSTNKVDIQTLIGDFSQRTGMTFEQFVNNEIMTAKINGDKELVAKYILGLSKYYLPEPTHKVDVTSAGEQLRANFAFVPVELSEWQQK